MRALLFLFLLAGCDDDETMMGRPDLSTVPVGATCANLSGIVAPCAPGLKCCTVPCTIAGDGGCRDLPSECEPDPPPAGYRDCF